MHEGFVWTSWRVLQRFYGDLVQKELQFYWLTWSISVFGGWSSSRQIRRSPVHRASDASCIHDIVLTPASVAAAVTPVMAYGIRSWPCIHCSSLL